MDTSYAVLCGIDVGKSEHHAVGLAVDGTRLYDKALPNDEGRLRAVLYPGQSETDARDAFINADTAQAMPHTLRRVDTGDDTLAELDVLIGFDDHLR